MRVRFFEREEAAGSPRGLGDIWQSARGRKAEGIGKGEGKAGEPALPLSLGRWPGLRIGFPGPEGESRKGPGRTGARKRPCSKRTGILQSRMPGKEPLRPVRWPESLSIVPLERHVCYADLTGAQSGNLARGPGNREAE